MSSGISPPRRRRSRDDGASPPRRRRSRDDGDEGHRRRHSSRRSASRTSRRSSSRPKSRLKERRSAASGRGGDKYSSDDRRRRIRSSQESLKGSRRSVLSASPRANPMSGNAKPKLFQMVDPREENTLQHIALRIRDSSKAERKEMSAAATSVLIDYA